MMFALNIDSKNRVLSATHPEYASADDVIVDVLPNGDITDYLYVNGAYVYDPIPEEPAPEASDDSVWDELDAAYLEGVNSV